MSTTYAGDPTNYPAEITIPSDGDVPDAASVNAALEGLADRTARLGQLSVLNFIPGVTGQAFISGVFNPVERCWYFGAATCVIKKSNDLGVSVGADVSPAGAGDVNDMETDADGNLVAVSSIGDIYEYTQSTTTWATHTAALGIGDQVEPARVCYDATADSWFGVALQDPGFGAGVMLHKSSPDRATWTTTTTFPAVSTPLKPRVAAKPGRIVCVWHQTVTLKTGYSTDGGINFTAGSDVAVGFTPTHLDITYDSVSALFVCSAAESGGGGKIYTSPDGTSWTLVATTTDARLTQVKCLGSVWSAYDVASGCLAFSLDFGVTWRFNNFGPGVDAAFERLLVGNEQYMLTLSGGSRVWSGLRMGYGSGALVT